MSHARTQVRDATKTLVTGLATTGTNVHANRLRNFEDGDLPCLNVIDADEQAELISIDTYNRALLLLVEVRIKATAALDDDLDAAAAEVEAVLDKARPAGAKELTLVSSKKEKSGEGSQPHGLITLEFSTEYCTARGAPEVIV